MKRFCTMLAAAAVLLLLSACQKEKYYVDILPPETTVLSETTTPTIPIETVMVATTVPETDPTVFVELEEDDFVRVLDYIPNASQDLRYATENNFTGKQIYTFYEAYLRWGTVKKLMQVAEELEQQGLYIKIWDGFRPVSAQFTLWQVCPDPTYVANPEKGYSSHSRGNTIDLTLVDENGQELEMPTGFDDFSAKANRDYSDCTEMAAANARLLEETMEKYGFTGYYGEWWHFSDTQSYPVEEAFQPNAG